MHATRNDLPARHRARVEKLLNQRFADVLHQQAATRQAHWHAQGPTVFGSYGTGGRPRPMGP